jgi:TRAP-type transport system periplasmic protein
LTRSLAWLAAAAAATIAFAHSAHAAERSLKLLEFNQAASILQQALNDFVAKVNEDGKGMLKIELPLLGPAAIPPAGMGNAVKNGIVDIAVVPASYIEALAPIITGLAPAELSPEQQRKSGAIALVEAQLEKAGVHFLGQFGYGIRYHIYTSVPVNTLADFKTMRLRATGTYKPLFDALGAQPVMLRLSETFDAMQRGIVTGYGNVNNQIKLLGWLPITKYRIDPGFYNATLVHVINLKTWNSLDAKQRALLDRDEAWLEGPRSAALAKEDEALGDALEKEGVKTSTLPPADAKTFLRLAHDAMWAQINKRDPANGPKLEKLVSE